MEPIEMMCYDCRHGFYNNMSSCPVCGSTNTVNLDDQANITRMQADRYKTEQTHLSNVLDAMHGARTSLLQSNPSEALELIESALIRLEEL